ncbi:transposase [Streptomyces roseoverticillatus]|uniref:Transposase n=1 Tax=Streptomyces roseoverticillatus TaxID=66429 RepID=A0ABV3IXB4_9ACTN
MERDDSEIAGRSPRSGRASKNARDDRRAGLPAAAPGRGPRLCFHLKPGSYDTTSLIEVLEHVKTFHAGESVVLMWDGLSAHWSRGMRAWAADQDRLALELLPAYASELNPVELPRSSIKTRELANLAGDHLADVANAAERCSAGSAPTDNSPGPSSPTPD